MASDQGVVKGKTIAYARIGNFVVHASVPNVAPDESEWRAYVDWLKAVWQQEGSVALLVFVRGKAPSVEQRGMVTSELPSDAMRIAMIMENRALLAVVKVFGWFVPRLEVFNAGEVDRALAYLGRVRDPALEQLLEELGVGIRSVAAR